MVEAAADPRLFQWVERYGSPLNLVSPVPFRESGQRLTSTANGLGLPLEVYFARKANKCLCFVEACQELDLGVDTASEVELRQTLSSGINPGKMVCTAAIKQPDLLGDCVRHGVTIVVDNDDEAELLTEVAQAARTTAAIAIRVGGFSLRNVPWPSRFGFPLKQVENRVSRLLHRANGALRVEGLHFHLEGYGAYDRVDALAQVLRLVDSLRGIECPIEHVDIGGGFPMSYLEFEAQWRVFWETHRAALAGGNEPHTFRGHGLGLVSGEGRLHGTPACYPFHQTQRLDNWLASILNADAGNGHTIASAIAQRGLTLRCEPGRALLDGCGCTIAQVVHRKKVGEEWLIGLAMNGTQCRTGSEDFLVDPLLIPKPGERPGADEVNRGYLLGAYCTETDAILKRRLRFPLGVAPGDLLIFPNTAGYFMHFYECRSHQFPLARNLVWQGPAAEPKLDAIESAGSNEIR
ncbi:alanine racemase [Aeoliella sp.]|uniref:alanine racemase n=1 Tax=Aeoliella sp. TaxID=2795800 RepID=UPI003CCC2B57